MATIIEDIYKFSVDADQALSQTNKLINDIDSLEKKLSALDSTTEEYSATARELATAQKQLDTVLGQEAKTLKELNALASVQRTALNNLTIGSREYSAQLQALNATQQRISAATQTQTERVGGLVGMFHRASVGFQAFAGVLAAGGVSVGIDALVSLGTNTISTIAKFEKLGSVLKNTLGSNSAAQKALQEISEFAAGTPFQVDEIAEAYIALTNRGLQPTTKQLKQLGDVAASQGKSLSQFTEAILDATTGENERLKEFGIQATKAGNQVTFAFKGVQKTVANTPKAINEALLAFGDMQGVFGSMAAQSKTLSGAWSNLMDTIDQIAVSLGDRGLAAVARGAVDAVSGLVGAFADYIKVPMAQKVRDEQQEVNALVSAITSQNEGSATRNALMAELGQKYPEILKFLDIENSSTTQLIAKVEQLNAAYAQKITIAAFGDQLAEVEKKLTNTITEGARLQKKYGAENAAEEIKFRQQRISFYEEEINRQKNLALSTATTAKQRADIEAKAKIASSKIIAKVDEEQLQRSIARAANAGQKGIGGRADLEGGLSFEATTDIQTLRNSQKQQQELLKESADIRAQMAQREAELTQTEAGKVLGGVKEVQKAQKDATDANMKKKKEEREVMKGTLEDLEKQLKIAEDILQNQTKIKDVPAVAAATKKIESIKAKINDAKKLIDDLSGKTEAEGKKAIDALQPKADDTFEGQRKAAIQSAEKQKSEVVGLEAQKAEQIRLINEQLQRDLDAINTKELEAEFEASERILKMEKEIADDRARREKELSDFSVDTQLTNERILMLEREKLYFEDTANLQQRYDTGIINTEAYNTERQNLDADYEQAKLDSERRILQIQLDALTEQANATNNYNAEQIAAIEAQIAKIDATVIDGADDVAKSLGERFRSFNEDYIQPIANGISEVVNAIGQFADETVDRYTELADRSKNTLDDMLSNSEDFNAAQVQAEKDRLEELTAAQAKAIREQQALRIIGITVDSVAAIAAAAAQGGAAAPFTIAATLIALAAGIRQARSIANSFYDGTDYVPLGGNKKGRDTVPAMLHEGEAVIQANRNKEYHTVIKAIRRGQIPAKVLNDFVSGYGRVTDNAVQGYAIGGNIDITPIANGLVSVENAVKGLAITVSTTQVNLTSNGITHTVSNTQKRLHRQRRSR